MARSETGSYPDKSRKLSKASPSSLHHLPRLEQRVLPVVPFGGQLGPEGKIVRVVVRVILKLKLELIVSDKEKMVEVNKNKMVEVNKNKYRKTIPMLVEVVRIVNERKDNSTAIDEQIMGKVKVNIKMEVQVVREVDSNQNVCQKSNGR